MMGTGPIRVTSSTVSPGSGRGARLPGNRQCPAGAAPAFRRTAGRARPHPEIPVRGRGAGRSTPHSPRKCRRRSHTDPSTLRYGPTRHPGAARATGGCRTGTHTAVRAHRSVTWNSARNGSRAPPDGQKENLAPRRSMTPSRVSWTNRPWISPKALSRLRSLTSTPAPKVPLHSLVSNTYPPLPTT